MKESKSERFIRLVEARTNKATQMIRLIGKCSLTNVYAYTPEQVEQVFAYLQKELDKAKARFQENTKRRFTLTRALEEMPAESPQEDPTVPSISISLPDGTELVAKAFAEDAYPAINLYWEHDGASDLICFAEHNPEKAEGHRLYIGAYDDTDEDCAYYQPFSVEDGKTKGEAE